MDLSFNQRQEQTFAYQLRHARKIAMNRDLLRRNKKMPTSDADDQTPDSVEEFMQLLVKRYGSFYATPYQVCRGWRAGMLEHTTQEKLSFQEFCKVARSMGYGGNVKKLWETLVGMPVEDGFAQLTLRHLDPSADEAIEAFRTLCRDKYGNIVDAWKKCLDQNKNGRLDKEEFLERCKFLGYKGNIARLFGLLLLEQGHSHLTMRDLDPHMMKNLYSGHHELIYHDKNAPHEDVLNLTFLERQELSLQARLGKKISHAQRAANEEFSRENAKKQLSASTLGTFKRLLVNRYGSIVRAWRKGLDSDGNGRLSLNEFMIAARSLGYSGNIKNLWHTLDDDDTGFITLDELDTETFANVKIFRDKIIGLYGNVLSAWKAFMMAHPEDQTINFNEFKEICKTQLKWLPKKQKEFFYKVLIPESHRKVLRLDDLDILLVGVEKKDVDNIWFGGKLQKKNSLLFHHGTVDKIKAVAEDELRIQAILAEIRADHTIPHFKSLCERRFGSMYRTFCFFDREQQGRIDWDDFQMGLKSMGFSGSDRKLWLHMMDENSEFYPEFLTLKDFDEESDKILRRFHGGLAKKGFQNALQAWNDGFDTVGKGKLSQDEFVKKCKDLGVKGNTKSFIQLFDWHTSKKRKEITYPDLDTRTADVYYGGDRAKFSSSQTKPDGKQFSATMRSKRSRSPSPSQVKREKDRRRAERERARKYK